MLPIPLLANTNRISLIRCDSTAAQGGKPGESSAGSSLQREEFFLKPLLLCKRHFLWGGRSHQKALARSCLWQSRF